MNLKVNSFTFDRSHTQRFHTLSVGQHVQVLVLDLYQPCEELLWLRVVEPCGNGLYRAETLDAAQHFPELPDGDTVYLKAEHARAAYLPMVC